MAKVAFVGLGVMGYPMAGHLKTKGGHEVTVYNRTAAKAEKWVAQYGGKSAPTPKAAAAGQDFVMACVGNDNDLRQVMLGTDGVFAGTGKGSIVVDHTTASAAIARELHAEAKQRGFDFVDAPVSGGQAGAENGVLTVMCGGDEAPFAKAEKVIAAIIVPPRKRPTKKKTTVVSIHKRSGFANPHIKNATASSPAIAAIIKI